MIFLIHPLKNKQVWHPWTKIENQGFFVTLQILDLVFEAIEQDLG